MLYIKYQALCLTGKKNNSAYSLDGIFRSELVLEDKLQFEEMHCSLQARVRVYSAGGHKLLLWARYWLAGRTWTILSAKVAVISVCWLPFYCL